MVAELVPPPPPLVGCLDLDPALQRHAVERLRRIKARVTAQELAAVRALDAGLGDKARTGEMLARGFGRDKYEADRTVRVAKTLSSAPTTEPCSAPCTTTKPTTKAGNSAKPPTAAPYSQSSWGTPNRDQETRRHLATQPPLATLTTCNSLSRESL